jgi:hypothetical protein
MVTTLMGQGEGSKGDFAPGTMIGGPATKALGMYQVGSALKVRSSSKVIAFPRQAAMFLMKQLTSPSLQKIGKQFGGQTPHRRPSLHQQARKPFA